MLRSIILGTVLALFTGGVSAQSNVFTYQGKLTDGGAPANGTYLLQFSLFDAATGGNQIGQTLSFDGGLDQPAVQVVNGIFTVELDFGVPTPPGDNIPRWNGNPRWISLAVRKIGELTFTPLSPRQPITSAPYAIRSASASTADSATNALQLAGVAASQYVVTTDPRMTDSRAPTTGSSNYIQNGTSPQPSTNFSIGGDGLVGGRIGVGTISPLFKLHVLDTSNTGLRVQTNAAGGTVASFGGSGAFQIDSPGVNGGRLQITENGNVGLGTPTPGAKLDVNGTGRFAGNLTLNGTVSLNGNSGQAGQVATSNGAGSAPQWSSPTNTLYQQTNMSSTTAAITPAPATPTLVPGLSQTVTVSGNTKLLAQFGVQAGSTSCFGCSNSVAEIDLALNGGVANRMEYELINDSHTTMSGSWLMSVGPGTYTIDVKAELLTGPSITFGCGTGCLGYNSYLIVQAIPQ